MDYFLILSLLSYILIGFTIGVGLILAYVLFRIGLWGFNKFFKKKYRPEGMEFGKND